MRGHRCAQRHGTDMRGCSCGEEPDASLIKIVVAHEVRRLIVKEVRQVSALHAQLLDRVEKVICIKQFRNDTEFIILRSWCSA